MYIQDAIPWHGDIEVIISQAGKIHRQQFHNLITTDGKNLLRDALLGLAIDLQVKYVAVGNGTAAPDVTQHMLVNELFRKPITSSSQGGDGQANGITYIAPYEANFTIEEIGWFAGSNASTNANSGVMIARALWHKDKSDRMSLQISRVDSIG